MRRFTIVSLAVLFFTGLAIGQTNTTGQLSGTVTSDGQPLPGVTVTITSPNLQGTRTYTTGANGEYVFKYVPPGVYSVSFELSGMKTVVQTASVELGGNSVSNAAIDLAATTETVTVTDAALDVQRSAVHGATYEAETISELPIARNLAAIASLSPGLTTNTPNAGQVKISGAFAFDNVFLIDGVDINDNLFGTATNGLVIEEAVEETQILTSNISAEYGRFSGGVINAITKSGGNEFHGGVRVDFTNDDWRDNTPFEDANNVEHPDKLNQVYSGTLGGKILTDRLWFFAAGRLFETDNQVTLPTTGFTFAGTDKETRYEAKLTGNIAPGHSLQLGYTRSDREVFQATFGFTVETAGLITPEFPTDLFVGTYTGILTPNLSATLQYSQKTFQFKNFGGTSDRIQDSPFLTLTIDPFAHFGEPYFDATDPENRDNDQWAGSLSYYLSTAKLGTHDLKIGGEWFTSTSIGGNSQTPTDYVFYADYANNGGVPIFDANGRLIPDFVSGDTLLLQWLAVRGAESNIETKGVYINDSWKLNRHLTANIGFRYEKVDGEGPGGVTTADEDSFVPRLGILYDIMGDGRFTLSGSYAQYAGRFHDGQFNNGTNVGNPDLVYFVYVGPDGQGYDFAPAFDLNNYVLAGGNFPTANVFLEEGLKSPLTTEWTASAGGRIFPNFSAAVTYVWRDTENFFEGFTQIEDGTTTIIRNGENFGTFDNVVYRNTDDLFREYQAIQFQSTYNISPHVIAQLNYTHMLKYEGNSEGENTNQPGVTSVFGDFPEIYVEDRNFPSGRLLGYQKHKLRFLLNFGIPTKFGNFALGGIYNFDSGTPYSFIAAGEDLSDIQLGRDPGYQNPPVQQDIYFGGRGSQLFGDIHRVDLALNYEIPVWKTLAPYLKFSVFNVLGADDLVTHGTGITPCRPENAGTTRCPTAPVDANGIPTTFTRNATFGTARSVASHQRAREFLISGGIRF